MAFYSDKLNVTFTNPSATDTFGTYVVEIYNSDTEEYYEIYRGRIFVFGGKDLVINLNDILENYKIDFSWLLKDGADNGVSRLYEYRVKVTLTVNNVSTNKTIYPIYSFYNYENTKQQYLSRGLSLFRPKNIELLPKYPFIKGSKYNIDFNFYPSDEDYKIFTSALGPASSIGNISFTPYAFNYEKNQISLSRVSASTVTRNIYLAILDYPTKSTSSTGIKISGDISGNFSLLTEDESYYIYGGDDSEGNPIYYIPWISIVNSSTTQSPFPPDGYKIVFTTKKNPAVGDTLYSTTDYKYNGTIIENTSINITTKNVVFRYKWTECYSTLQMYNDEFNLYDLRTLTNYLDGFPYTLVDSYNNIYRNSDKYKWDWINETFVPANTGHIRKTGIEDLNTPGLLLVTENTYPPSTLSALQYYKLLDLDLCPARFYIKWVDRMGGIQSQPFRPYNKYTEDLKRENIENQYREKRPSNITVTSKWELCTDYFDEKYYPIYESMLVSPYVILYDTENDLVHNVIVTDNSYEEKTFDNEKKLISFKVNLELNHTQNITY